VELLVNGSILAGWTTTSPGSYSESGGRIVIADAGGTAGIFQDLPTEIGKTYVASIDAESTTTAQLGVFVGGGFVTQLATTANITTRSVQRLVFVATTNSIRLYYRETGGAGGVAYAKDTSVREVLEWTNAASFNGTTNSMQLATNPIGANLSQPYTIIVAGVVGALGAPRRLVGDASRRFAITAIGSLAIVNGGVSLQGPIQTVFAGNAYVFEITWDGSTVTVRQNGVPVLSGALAAPTGTPGNFFVGQNGDGTSFFNGQLAAVSVFDRVLTDSERATIGKAFARELGVTYG
jgi:hypothetical protein